MEKHFYLNFREETGVIWKLTNELDTSTPYIEIDRETMIEFAEERKKMDDYIVVPSTDSKVKYEIKFKHKDLTEFDVDKSIHQFPKVKTINTDSAFVVRQNLKQGKWTIELSKELRDILTSTLYYKDKNQLIYICKKDNPNVLLEFINLPFYKILYTDSYELEDVDKKVALDPNVSLYCGKVFENYFHIQEAE